MIIPTTIFVTSPTASSADPENVTVTEANTTLEYILDKDSRAQWMMIGLTFDNSKGQMVGVTVDPSGNSVSVMDINTKTADIGVTVHYQQRTSTLRASLDPGVLNRPPLSDDAGK